MALKIRSRSPGFLTFTLCATEVLINYLTSDRASSSYVFLFYKGRKKMPRQFLPIEFFKICMIVFTHREVRSLCAQIHNYGSLEKVKIVYGLNRLTNYLAGPILLEITQDSARPLNEQIKGMTVKGDFNFPC